MFPWGHAAVGYLVYTVYSRKHLGVRPQAVPVLALALGTQFPDLIDKPLAWHLHVLPNGRSLGHSLVVVTGLLLGLWLVFSTPRDRKLLTAFGIGAVSHLFGDALYPALGGEWYYLGFLFWPVVPPITYDTTGGIVTHLLAVEVTPVFVFEIVLTLVATGLWLSHGRPGLRRLWSAGTRFSDHAR